MFSSSSLLDLLQRTFEHHSLGTGGPVRALNSQQLQPWCGDGRWLEIDILMDQLEE